MFFQGANKFAQIVVCHGRSTMIASSHEQSHRCCDRASRGIGRACALAWHSARKSALAARQIDKLDEVAAEIRAAEAKLSPPNSTSARTIRSKRLREDRQRIRRVDILVNNAGVTRDGLAIRMKRDDWIWCCRPIFRDLSSAFSRCCPA